MPAPAMMIARVNMYWTWLDGPSRKAAVAQTAKVDFSAV